MKGTGTRLTRTLKLLGSALKTNWIQKKKHDYHTYEKATYSYSFAHFQSLP